MEQFGHTLSAKHLLAISLSLACFWFWLLFLGLTIEWWIPQPLAAFKSTRMTWCSQLGFGQPPGPHFLFFFGVQLSWYLGNNLKEEVKKKKKKVFFYLEIYSFPYLIVDLYCAPYEWSWNYRAVDLCYCWCMPNSLLLSLYKCFRLEYSVRFWVATNTVRSLGPCFL